MTLLFRTALCQNRHDESGVEHETLGAVNEKRRDRCICNGINQEKLQKNTGSCIKTA